MGAGGCTVAFRRTRDRRIFYCTRFILCIQIAAAAIHFAPRSPHVRPPSCWDRFGRGGGGSPRHATHSADETPRRVASRHVT